MFFSVWFTFFPPEIQSFPIYILFFPKIEPFFIFLFLNLQTKQKPYYMQTTFIIAVALSVAIVIAIVCLCCALVYCRWRRSELMSGLGEFLNENRRLRQEIQRSKTERNESEMTDDDQELSSSGKV